MATAKQVASVIVLASAALVLIGGASVLLARRLPPLQTLTAPGPAATATRYVVNAKVLRVGDNKPLAGVQFYLTDLAGNVVASPLTDAAGAVTIPLATNASYLLRVSPTPIYDIGPDQEYPITGVAQNFDFDFIGTPSQPCQVPANGSNLVTNPPCYVDLTATATHANGQTETSAPVRIFITEPSPTPTPAPAPLPFCASGQKPGSPPVCRCRNGTLGNSGKCR